MNEFNIFVHYLVFNSQESPAQKLTQNSSQPLTQNSVRELEFDGEIIAISSQNAADAASFLLEPDGGHFIEIDNDLFNDEEDSGVALSNNGSPKKRRSPRKSQKRNSPMKSPKRTSPMKSPMASSTPKKARTSTNLDLANHSALASQQLILLGPGQSKLNFLPVAKEVLFKAGPSIDQVQTGPKKRGRKPHDPEVRARNKKLQNQKAAQKLRAKKKNEDNQLEEEFKLLEVVNAQKRHQLELLENEIQLRVSLLPKEEREIYNLYKSNSQEGKSSQKREESGF